MTSRRQLKAAEAIREVISTSILTEVRDPRVQGVTVLGVQISPDMREAKVFVSVMGDQEGRDRSLEGLRNSAGFLQARIANRIDMRYTPKLFFCFDQGIKNIATVASILNKIRNEHSPKSVDNSLSVESSVSANEVSDGKTVSPPAKASDRHQ